MIEIKGEKVDNLYEHVITIEERILDAEFTTKIEMLVRTDKSYSLSFEEGKIKKDGSVKKIPFLYVYKKKEGRRDIFHILYFWNNREMPTLIGIEITIETLENGLSLVVSVYPFYDEMLFYPEYFRPIEEEMFEIIFKG